MQKKWRIIYSHKIRRLKNYFNFKLNIKFFVIVEQIQNKFNIQKVKFKMLKESKNSAHLVEYMSRNLQKVENIFKEFLSGVTRVI